MGLLNDAAAWLNTKLTQAAASDTEVVVYARGAEQVTLTGLTWVGRTVFSRVPRDAGGAAVVFGDRDYLIPASVLVLSGETTEPKRGDRITHTLGGVEKVFEVVAMPGEPEWRWSDAGRTRYRVHTKEQKAA